MEFVFGATVNVRRLVDSESFASIIEMGSELRPLLEASQNEAYIKSTFHAGRPGFFLFHENHLAHADSILYGRVFEEFVAVTFAAVGLDVRGLVAIDKDAEGGQS